MIGIRSADRPLLDAAASAAFADRAAVRNAINQSEALVAQERMLPLYDFIKSIGRRVRHAVKASA